MKRWCVCGHHANDHTGANTECYGRVAREGRNAIGVKFPPGWCLCTAFRRTKRSWWQYHFTRGPESPTAPH